MKPIFRMRGGVEYDLAVVGGAGVAGVVRQSYSIVEEEFARFFDANGRNPSTDILDNIHIRFENNRVMMGPLEPTQFLKIKERVRRRIEMIEAVAGNGDNRREQSREGTKQNNKASNKEEHRYPIKECGKQFDE